jgi:hypothetical protein
VQLTCMVILWRGCIVMHKDFKYPHYKRDLVQKEVKG